MVIYNVFDQVSELIASLPSAKVLGLTPSEELKKRFEFLMEKAKNQQISASDKDELDHFIVLERLIRLAKIRASHP
ncbi:MAG: hypothetical protein U0Y10_06685 [Spirosomataceae bacterium]